MEKVKIERRRSEVGRFKENKRIREITCEGLRSLLICLIINTGIN